MSDSSKNLSEVYDDIDLCYKVMGLTFSDPPDQVDKVYRKLVDGYNRDMHTTDPAARKAAQENLNQTKELYERITSSLIYKDYAREYEKYKQVKEAERKARGEKAQAEKDIMVNCPHCRKMISPKLKVCMYCHGKILSPMELIMAKIFTTKNIIAALVVLALIGAGVAYLMLK